MLDMSDLHWHPATFSLYASTLVGVALEYALGGFAEPDTVKMQEYSKST